MPRRVSVEKSPSRMRVVPQAYRRSRRVGDASGLIGRDRAAIRDAEQAQLGKSLNRLELG
jgi:hypothetical protein